MSRASRDLNGKGQVIVCGSFSGLRRFVSPIVIVTWTLFTSTAEASFTSKPALSSSDIPQWWTECMNKGADAMSGKSASSKDVLNCCAVVWGCDCVAKACLGHSTYVRCANPKISCQAQCPPGNWTLPTCTALPNLSFFARNPWIWLVVVGVLVAIVILVIICLVYRKKFGSNKHHKKNKSMHFGLGHRMNVNSNVRTAGGEQDENGHRKRRKDTKASLKSSRKGMASLVNETQKGNSATKVPAASTAPRVGCP